MPIYLCQYLNQYLFCVNTLFIDQLTRNNLILNNSIFNNMPKNSVNEKELMDKKTFLLSMTRPWTIREKKCVQESVSFLNGQSTQSMHSTPAQVPIHHATNGLSMRPSFSASHTSYSSTPPTSPSRTIILTYKEKYVTTYNTSHNPLLIHLLYRQFPSKTYLSSMEQNISTSPSTKFTITQYLGHDCTKYSSFFIYNSTLQVIG